MTQTNTYSPNFVAYEHVTQPNRYPGQCPCGAYVAAGEGFYSAGVYCTQPGSVGDIHDVCEVDARIAAKDIEKQRQRNAELADRKPVLTEAQLARHAKQAHQDKEWATQGLKRCGRCGGAGGASNWPGWACYDCGGFGTVPASNH